MTPDIDSKVAALVEELYAEGITDVTQIQIDVQASGELPYRVLRPDQALPEIGLATVEAV